MLNFLKIFNEKDLNKESNNISNSSFIDEKIEIQNVDYYYSNSIARSSKTMFECRNQKINVKSTGTEG